MIVVVVEVLPISVVVIMLLVVQIGGLPGMPRHKKKLGIEYWRKMGDGSGWPDLVIMVLGTCYCFDIVTRY